ncbi:MAG: sensor histidine kinase [Chloroflexi bacterium]|nr:sensor histidine kinase [Chloroflexota bacterium]MBI4504620.1 sensor histidine kinase [Chloroflexota bacterium]
MLGRLSFAGQFLLVSLAVLLAGMLIIGTWVGEQIAGGVLNRTTAVTALYVDSVVTPYLQSLASEPHLSAGESAALDGLLTNTRLSERIVAFKVWSPGGEVLYSPNSELVGRRFAVGGGLARALDGEVVGGISNLEAAENEAERKRWQRLLEVYAPVREQSGGRVIAVTEFYQLPDELEREVAAARLRSWGVVAAATLAMYLLLAGMVRRASNTIVGQQAALRQKVAELSQLLEQNTRLHEQVRRAGEQTTALNERLLRRISADLHDGPGQALALALLRLDTLRERCAACAAASDEFPVVHSALRDALGELRTIAGGLRPPEFEAFSLAEVVERAVRDHRQRSGIAVETRAEHLPSQAPLPIKIALYRSLQEALSNATRHGGGVGVSARAWVDAGWLHLEVSDSGPGFLVEQVDANGRLGLAGMRERAALLGGSLRVESQPGRGTRLHLRWPLARSEDA